ncbi:lipid-binding SYLF domain-containing protein [Variovorax rhizosphaerae]|uniref:Lipid-binding SYLF domain-containing protein n=1 Tax=Variovorax rhizosphaerae TaxID=1836200 RepID=A0ABU8WMB3_9BURK
MDKSRRNFMLATGAFGLAAANRPALAAVPEDAQALVLAAEATVDAFTRRQDIEGFVAAVAQTRGVLVFPRIVKAGFVLAGAGGTGVLLVRDQRTNNEWRGPAFYNLSTASLGLQLGASWGDLIVLVNTQNALNALYNNPAALKFGGEASFAFWDKGMNAGASGTTDYLAYSTDKGAFFGLAIDGSVLSARQSLNDAYYGKPASPLTILFDPQVSNPAAQTLQASVKRLRANGLSEWAR